MNLESKTETYAFRGRAKDLLKALRAEKFSIEEHKIYQDKRFYNITSGMREDGSNITYGEISVPKDRTKKKVLVIYNSHLYPKLKEFVYSNVNSVLY